MPHLFRPTYTLAVPKHATIRTVNGAKIAQWTGRGNRIIKGVVSEDGKRCTVTSDCWYLSYTNRSGKRQSIKLYPDKKASEKKADLLLQRLDKIDAGLPVPGGPTLDERSLLQLVDDWEKHLAARGGSPKHIAVATCRVRKIIEALGLFRPGDIAARPVERWLDRQRAANEFGAQTANHYLTQLRTFTLWLVKQEIIPFDPLASIEKLNADVNRTFERRALTDDEIRTLLTAAEADRKVRRGLNGPDRAAAYRIAIYTGLRRGEIAQLRKAWFHLGDKPPTIRIPATVTKNRRAVSQVVPDHIALVLIPWLATATDEPFSEWGTDHAASALRSDLERAGIEAETESGRVDFHALRATYITLLARAGIPIQHAQRLARLSTPTIMMKHYAKLGESDLAEKVADLGKPQHK